jgi:hypothetical protein
MIGRPLTTLAAAGLICLLASPLARAQSPGAAGGCYLIADNNGIRFDADVLTRIDKSSGVETEIGVTGTINIEAVAFHPFQAEIYAADGGRLGIIDPSTGAFTPIGWLGTAYGEGGPVSAGDADGLTFDPSTADLFGSIRRGDSDLLVQIDPASGRVIEDAFGPGRSYVRVRFGTGPVDVDDLAISPLSGTLFAVVTDANEVSTLVTIDRRSGFATRAADLGTSDLEGLTFDFDGHLYASPGGDGPSMVEISLVDGSVTAFAAIGVGGNRDYEAITCMTYGEAASTATEEANLPTEIALLSAYPNPFNPTTAFRFSLPLATDIQLSVFDMLGREVQVLARGQWPAGMHEVRFNAGVLPSGLYLYRLAATDFVATRSVTLLR